MKDAVHHLRWIQKKVLKSVRKEQENANNQEIKAPPAASQEFNVGTKKLSMNNRRP